MKFKLGMLLLAASAMFSVNAVTVYNCTSQVMTLKKFAFLPLEGKRLYAKQKSVQLMPGENSSFVNIDQIDIKNNDEDYTTYVDLFDKQTLFFTEDENGVVSATISAKQIIL